MASIDDILKRGGISRATQGTDITTSPNRVGAGANAQAIPALIRDTREYNVQKEIEKVDHDNPLLTTANLENSNPLISIPANTVNLGGRIVSNIDQGIANAQAIYHEGRANAIEGTLPQEVFDMQSKIDYAEGELDALKAKLRLGMTGSLQEHMKLIGEISSKSTELSKQRRAVEETGYADSIRELKEQRVTSQFMADRTRNGVEDVFNTKLRDRVQQKIQTEVNSWKLANPKASALDQIKASSEIAAKHYTDSPLEIGNMAVESAVTLLNPFTLGASAASQGANFYVTQTKKYNEAEGRTAIGLVSGKEHAALAAGTAAYTALNFYADKVLQKAIFPSANSAFQRAEAAALEAATRGATEAAALRTAANALRPTVKGTLARGAFAAGQEYPVEAISSMMEDQWGHGRHTGDWTPFGVGGTAGLLAGGAMTAPSTLAGVGGAVVGNIAAAQADAATNPENKRYNPTTDMAQAYGDILNSPNATPEQVSAARTKAKDILSSTQSRLSEMTQIQEAVASGDVGSYFASTLERDIDDINSQIASGNLTDAEAIAKVDELEATYELLAEKASAYVGKSKKLDSEVNKLRKDLVASTKYHSKMSENINLTPDTIQAIKDRQAIIESSTASLEDLERATQDIIAYPMVATVSQLQKAMSLPNLTPEAYESLRVLTDFQIQHKGESLSKVRRHITEGSTGYRGLPEYIQGLTQAFIDGDTNSVNSLMYDIGAFAQSHEKKAEAIADVIQNVPAGSKWQIARDKQNQWYVIKDEAKFLTGDKASGAYTIHKGSAKLLEAVQQEVQMIKDTQAAMQATMDLREQMQIEPTDMSTYNRIKYAGQLPLTHATTMEEVAKFEAMLDQSNQVVAFDAEGNPHNVTVIALHPNDASKVMVTIEGESKKFATTRDRLAVFDSTGNLLYDVRNQEDTPQVTPTEVAANESVEETVAPPKGDINAQGSTVEQLKNGWVRITTPINENTNLVELKNDERGLSQKEYRTVYKSVYVDSDGVTYTVRIHRDFNNPDLVTDLTVINADDPRDIVRHGKQGIQTDDQILNTLVEIRDGSFTQAGMSPVSAQDTSSIASTQSSTSEMIEPYQAVLTQNGKSVEVTVLSKPSMDTDGKEVVVIEVDGKRYKAYTSNITPVEATTENSSNGMDATNESVDGVKDALIDRDFDEELYNEVTKDKVSSESETQEVLVERPEYISRQDVQSNPDKLFLFGDNDKREGFGGQAKAMRGEPNVVGIRTKAAPSMDEGSFWSDDTYAENIRKIDEDFKAAFEFEGTVVIPKAGLGTGLSKLDDLAPKTLAHIEMRITELEAGKPMSEAEVEAQSNEESDSDPRADVADTEAEPTTLNIWAGTGENASLSNLSERPFTVKGRAYRSVEHAYQSLKSGKFDQATYDKYQNLVSVEGVKIVGKLGTNQEISERLMEALITASFKQNPEALAQLLATGNATLTHTQDRGHWKEAFPRILMKVREELREDPNSTKGNTPPKSGNRSTGTGQASISNVSIVGQRLEDMQEEARNEAIADAILQKVDIEELIENISPEWQMAVSTRVTNAVLMAYNNLRYRQEIAKLNKEAETGNYTEEQINELHNELDDRDFGEELYNEVNGSQDDNNDTGDTNIPPQAKTPVEEQTEASETTPQYPRTVAAKFDVLDEIVDGTITFNGDGTATVTVGKKILSIEVTPENEKSFKQLGNAINLADPSIELGEAQLLTAEEMAKIHAEIYGDDAEATAEDDPTEEIISRTDDGLDEVNVENAEGLLEAFKNETSDLGKRFKQVGSQVFAKPFIAVKNFFTSLDWNTPRIFDYLEQFLATATNSITEDDVNTIHALRNFHQGMGGNNFSKLIKDQVNTMLEVTDSELLTTEHNLFSQMISYDSEGNPVIEENVLGAMSVAAYDYILKNADFHVNSDKGVNFMLGVTSDQFIRGEDSKKYRRLTTRREKLIQELGDSAVRALGIKTKKGFTEDEALKLGASMGAVIYHAMKQRYLNEKFYYRHSILADVQKHMGYTTAKRMYEDWMEQKYNKGEYLTYPKYLKALRQFNRIITTPNSGLRYKEGNGSISLHELIKRLQGGTNDKMIPSIVGDNLIGNATARAELIGLIAELRDARTEMNTPTFFAGIVQNEGAIRDNEDPRNQARRREPGWKKRDEQSEVVKKVIRGVPKRSDTLHKVFGLDRGKIDPLAAPVPFKQQDIKKSKGKVSTEQARILNKIQQEPLVVKSFTRSVSWLNKNYTDMLHHLIGAKPALDTLYVDKRVNTEAAARNLIKELDQAIEYVDTITNEDGTWNKFYHELVVWSNNRFGYASNVFNLQTSKIARSMSTYEKNVATLTKTVDGTSVNDIFGSDGNLTEYGKLIHGVAIYAEKSTSKKNVIYDEDYMGDTTVDKAPNEVLLPELHKRLYENFKPHFDAIRKMNAQEELTDSDQRLIVELVGEMGSGIQSLEAAVELVTFWDTKKGETFQSHLTVESDGITNGMIINQIQNGTATIDMLVEGGLLTKNEMSDNPNASFFTLKRDGRNGEALQDYYTRAGTRQKEAWEFIKSKLNLGSFDTTMSDEQNLVQAIAYIDKTFGERKGAKAFATPDNYAAGLDRIKEIVADHFVDNLFGAVEDFGKVGDNEGLVKLLEATNTIIRFHNTYLAEIDGLESKWNDQKKRFEVQYSGTEKVSSLLKRAMMTATAQHAAQDKYVTDSEGKLRAEHVIFDSAAVTDLASYGNTVMDLAELYSNAVARQLGLKKGDKLPSYTALLLTDDKTPEQIKADQVQYRKHMNTYLLNVLHAQSSQFRSRQVPEVNTDVGSAQAAVNYRIWDDAQLNALRAVSNVTQGTATVHALKRMNAQFYRVRDANIKMMGVAYNVYQTIWDTVARQILDRRIRKTGLPTDELNNGTPLTSLLTVEDVKELERTMEKFLPTGTTTFSHKSKNRSTSGAVFLDKVAKLFTEAVHTQNIRFDSENKTIDNYLTGVYKEVEQSIGLKGNSAMTQSVDAYVSTNALDNVLGGNFHDSNGFNIGNYQEGAQAQNTAFFDAMIEYSAQEGFADAVLLPLKAFLEDGTVIKSGATIEKVLDAASKYGEEDVLNLLTIMLQAETKKLALLAQVERVQQYGTEDGHVDVTPKQKAKIAKAVKRIEERETSIQELAALINTSPSKIKIVTPKNPLPSYATTLHPNTIGQVNVDADAAEDANTGNTFVQSLLAQGTENLEVADVVKTVEDYLDANPSELSKYYKLVLSMLPNAVKAGTKVNIFNPHAIPAHVKGEKVLQMERHTQGWYTEDQINLVYSSYAALTPETFVHEMIHAALANFIRTELRKAKKESKDGKPNWEAVHPAVRDLQNIRSQVRAAIEADPNLADIAEDYAVALRDIQEFVTYGMTNERFINVLKGIYIKQTAQHKDKSKFSLIGSLRSAFTAFIESATEMLLGETKKHKGNDKDAKINALAALVTNFSANLQAASEASMDMDFDEILQHVQTNAEGTQQEIREMKPKEIFEKLHQGNLSTEFQNHLRTDVLPLISEISESIGSTEVGRMFNEQVDPQTIWDDAVINGKVPYVSDLFSMGFPMSDQEAYAVESLEASLNAIIDYAYGSTVHREMDRMFVMARNKLKPRDFHDGDWKTASVNEKMVAREKWNKLFNLSENLDNEGRNRFLTRFMALTLGSEKFNKLLNKVDTVPEELEGASTVYEYVLNRFHRFIDWIAERAARTGNEPKIQGRISILAHQLAEIDAKRKNHLMNQSSKNPFMNVDSIGNGAMDKVRLVIRSLVEAEMFSKSPLTPVKAASEFGSLLLKQNLEELPDQIMQLRANLHPNTLPGALAEIQQEMGRPVGIRKKIMAMISLSSKVQKERETMRQHIQREVTQMFDERGEYLQPEDWKALTNVILRSGLSRLYFEEYEPNVIYELIRDKEARQQEIASIEAELRQGIDGGIKIHRTKQLARYMVTSKAHTLQAQNTLQISAGVGLKDSVQTPSWFDSEVKLLNRLVSLYNLNYQDQAEIQRVSKVLDREASRLDNGVEHLLRFHQKLAADSAMQFADNPFSQSQSYTPEIHNTNRDIQYAAHKGEMQELVRLGYKQLSGVQLSKAAYDVDKSNIRVMYNMHADNQRIVDGGLMLNTTDAKGTDIGIEDIQATTKELARKLIRESRNPNYDPSKDTETHGVPKLNAEGKVTGMRYTMLNKTRDELLERNNHPADLMAEYAASNLDLMNVEKVNTPVLEALHQDYLDNYETRPQDFVELSSKSEDPELVRMYRMIPYKSREHLKSLFGGDPIMVNANVMTIAFGYRKYTPTDIFKKDADERNIVEAAYAGALIGVFGEERAATVSSHMVKGTMEIMRKVKDFYVIRNFHTLFTNTLSNNAILLAYGVTPFAMARDTKVALQAGLKYKKDYSLYIQYKVKLQLGIGNMGENRQKMAYYEDSLKRNPLKEFIEAGMLSSIVEDIEQSKDDYSYQAALEKKFAGVIDTIPKHIRDGVNFVMVNQGSPLHKMLSDATAMADFAAKYVLYNYHTKKKGMSHEEALFESHEAFINYEVPSNKTLQFLNDIGLVMFTKYYLRIQRVIYILLRKHPASVLLQSYLLGSIAGMPTVLSSFAPSTMHLPVAGSVFESFSAVGQPIPLQLIF